MALIPFSILDEFPSDQVKHALLNNSHVFVIDFFSFLHRRRLLETSYAALAFVLRFLPMRRLFALATTIPIFVRIRRRLLREGWATGARILDVLQSYEIARDRFELVPIKPSVRHLWCDVVIWVRTLYVTALISRGKPTPLYLQGVESSGFLMDSLQRYVRNYRVENGLNIRNFLGPFRYLWRIVRGTRALAKLASNLSIHRVVINHNVYMESGWVAALFSELHGSQLIEVGRSKRSALEVLPRQRWFEPAVRDRMKNSTPRSLASAKNQSPSWYSDQAIAGISDLRSQDIDTHSFLIAMHCFADANDLHWNRSLIFPTYYHWIEKTVKVAESLPSSRFTFRVHPNLHHYASDERILARLFRKRYPHIRLEYPGEYARFPPRGPLPVVITSRGSIALEMASAGLRAICVAEPHAPAGTYMRVNTINEYLAVLGGGVAASELRLKEDLKKAASQYREALGYFSSSHRAQ